MSKQNGYIVTFKNAKGEDKKGIVYYKDQIQGVRDRKQVVVSEVDDGMNPIIRAGRRVMYFRAESDVTRIGFVD